MNETNQEGADNGGKNEAKASRRNRRRLKMIQEANIGQTKGKRNKMHDDKLKSKYKIITYCLSSIFILQTFSSCYSLLNSMFNTKYDGVPFSNNFFFLNATLQLTFVVNMQFV